ncbi:MAG TPA: hypothetical protein DEH22_13865 [Chloroflexi bacterium]|nr:hypothetical protein [Chloroflexota bacterium]
MSDVISAPANVFPCTQCGGELHPDEGQNFLVCPFCESTVYIDKTRVVFHWYLASTLDQPKAQANLARWMGGSATIKDLDKKARLAGSSFEFFPFWVFKSKDKSDNESLWLEPAAAISVSELKNITVPAGDLRKYDESINAQAHAPTIPLPTVMEWLKPRLPADAEISETALVHIPIYTFKYTYKGDSYTAIVEGATGGVFANIFPAKAESPFRIVGGLAAFIFLCLATFPVLGALTGGNGIAIGGGLCIGLGLLSAPFLFALAVWVAAKV